MNITSPDREPDDDIMLGVNYEIRGGSFSGKVVLKMMFDLNNPALIEKNLSSSFFI